MEKKLASSHTELREQELKLKQQVRGRGEVRERGGGRRRRVAGGKSGEAIRGEK